MPGPRGASSWDDSRCSPESALGVSNGQGARLTLLGSGCPGGYHGGSPDGSRRSGRAAIVLRCTKGGYAGGDADIRAHHAPSSAWQNCWSTPANSGQTEDVVVVVVVVITVVMETVAPVVSEGFLILFL